MSLPPDPVIDRHGGNAADTGPGPDGAGFRRVLAAEGIGNFGAMLSRITIPFLAALALQATPWQMAGLLLADVAAGAVAALLLGAWVDRAGKRAVMRLCEFGRAALLAVLAVAAALDQVSLAGLTLAAAASGVLHIGFELARSAWVAQCIATGQLPQRNAQLSMVGSLSETAAFALGGWIYQGLGAAWALAMDAGSSLASALCLRGVPEVRRAGTPSAAQGVGLGMRWRSAWRDWRDDTVAGLRAVATHPSLRALAGIEALLALSMSLTGTSYMIFVTRDLGLPTGPLGMVFALGGAGAVVGAVLAPRLGRRLGPGRTMALGLGAFALGAACIPLAAAVPAASAASAVSALSLAPLLLLAAHQIVGDAGHVLHDVHDRTLRQTAVAPEMLARADAGIRSLGQWCTLVGALAGGALGTALGARSVLVLATALAGAAALLALLTLARRDRLPAMA